MKISPTNSVKYSPIFNSKFYFNNNEIKGIRFLEEDYLRNKLMSGFDFYSGLRYNTIEWQSLNNIIARFKYLLNDKKNDVYQVKEREASVPQIENACNQRRTIRWYDFIKNGKTIFMHKFEDFDYKQFEDFIVKITPEYRNGNL